MVSPCRHVPLLLTALGALASGCVSPAGSETNSSSETADTSSDSDESGETGGDPLPQLDGFADLHLHMFAEEAFGGGWLHGGVEGAADIALAMCDGGVPGDHARLRDDLAFLFDGCDPELLQEASNKVAILQILLLAGGQGVSELLSDIPGSQGDTGLHEDRVGGWPELDGWPRWDAIAHQQVWEGWLEQAYDDGLRVSVMSAVSLDWLCRALPEANVTRPQCDEMDDVRVQLERANAFAASHDWLEIALSAEDARRIVSEDKLAMILSIEASHIFGEGDWEAQFDEVYALGVRTLQPVHQLDNRFGGAAPHATIFHLAAFNEQCHIDEDCGLTASGVTLGFDVDEDCRNVKGLTAEGHDLITAMIERNMLVDMAHMSEATTRDVYEIAVEHDYYPLYLSHAHFREMMVPGKAKEEKTTPSWIIQMVRESGGMIGLRTAHEETNTYTPSLVENSCHGSTRSFAQAYDYGQLGLDVAMGLGSDLNGFIQQTRPRFGDTACSASFPEEAQCQARIERLEGLDGLGTEFDEWGLAHAGMMGDLIDDLEQHGSNVEPLRRSADDFVVMWERASEPRSGAVEGLAPMNTEGVVVQPGHGARLAEMPTECGEPYCPSSLVSGDACSFDAECETGVCAGAGACGEPEGICE